MKVNIYILPSEDRYTYGYKDFEEIIVKNIDETKLLLQKLEGINDHHLCDKIYRYIIENISINYEIAKYFNKYDLIDTYLAFDEKIFGESLHGYYLVYLYKTFYVNDRVELFFTFIHGDYQFDYKLDY